MAKVPKFDTVDITGQNNYAISTNNLQVASDGSAVHSEERIKEYVRDLRNGLIGENELNENVLLKGFQDELCQNMSSKKYNTVTRSNTDFTNNTISFDIGPKPGTNFWSPSSTALILNIKFMKSSTDAAFPENTIVPTENFFSHLFKKFEIFDRNRNNESFYTQTNNKPNIEKCKRYFRSLPIPPTGAAKDVRHNTNLYQSDKNYNYTNRRAFCNNATAGNRTNDNIDERNTRFQAQFSANKTEVRIELKYLCEFFEIKYLENRVRLTITLENDMALLFERIDKQTNPSTITTTFKLNKTPKIFFHSYLFNSQTVQKQKNIAMYTGGQFLHSYGDFHEEKKELAAGLTEIQLDLQTRGKKIKKIGVLVSNKNSVAHSTPFDDRGVETASVDIKNIRLIGAPVFGNELKYDLTELEDKEALYSDYLQHNFNTSNSDSLTSYAEFTNFYNYPSIEEYYDRTTAANKRFGHEIILDLAETKNSFEIKDRTKTSDDMKLILHFHDATPADSATVSGKVLLIRFYFESSIVQIFSKQKLITEMMSTRYPDQEITFKDLAYNKGKPTFNATGVIKHLKYF